jgi:hypothetical protein
MDLRTAAIDQEPQLPFENSVSTFCCAFALLGNIELQHLGIHLQCRYRNLLREIVRKHFKRNRTICTARINYVVYDALLKP